MLKGQKCLPVVPFTVVLMVNGVAVQTPYSQTTAFRSEGGVLHMKVTVLRLFLLSDFNVVTVRPSILTVVRSVANNRGLIAVCLSVLRLGILRLFLENNRTLAISTLVRQCNCNWISP